MQRIDQQVAAAANADAQLAEKNKALTFLQEQDATLTQQLAEAQRCLDEQAAVAASALSAHAAEVGTLQGRTLHVKDQLSKATQCIEAEMAAGREAASEAAQLNTLVEEASCSFRKPGSGWLAFALACAPPRATGVRPSVGELYTF